MSAANHQQPWSTLVHHHPEPHLVVGWTRNVNRWRDEAFFDLLAVRKPAGAYAVKRDFDEKRGQFLLFAAFAQESDAIALAETAGAETTKRYPGYASQRSFKCNGKCVERLKVAGKR